MLGQGRRRRVKSKGVCAEGAGTVHVGTPAWLPDAHPPTSFASMLVHVSGYGLSLVWLGLV